MRKAGSRKFLILFFCTFVILIIILFYFGVFKKNSYSTNNDEAPSSPMRLDLSISNPPVIGETAEIIATITYLSRIKSGMSLTSASIILPRGLDLVSGNLEWRGELQPRSNFSVVVRAVELGNWTIEGISRNPPTGETYFGGRDFIYLSIGEGESSIQEWPFPEYRPCSQGVNCTMGEPQ